MRKLVSIVIEVSLSAAFKLLYGRRLVGGSMVLVFLIFGLFIDRHMRLQASPTLPATIDACRIAALTVQGTIPFGTSFGTHVSGGSLSGVSTPGDWTYTTDPFLDTTAANSLDHHWIQAAFGAPAIWDLGAPSNAAVVFPAIDHGPMTPVPYEAIEFTVWGSNDPSATFPDAWTLAKLTTVYADGWVDVGSPQESDDFASLWSFNANSFRFIAVYANSSVFITPEPIAGPFENDCAGSGGFCSFDCEIDAVGKPSGPQSIPPDFQPIPVSWKASPITSDCLGFADRAGRPWFDASFVDSGWSGITLPDVDSFALPGSGSTDRFYRGSFALSSTDQSVFLHIVSDDGIEIFVNGAHFNSYSPSSSDVCHALGCINIHHGGVNLDVAPAEIPSNLLQIGKNTIAAHVSNGFANSYFDMAIVFASPSLTFPLHGTISGAEETLNPCTATIHSVFDHSQKGPYQDDSRVVAYTGEEGTCDASNPNQNVRSLVFTTKTNRGLYGFRRADGEEFGINDHYTGGSGVCSTSPCPQGRDTTNVACNLFLFYDGHPGIDYKAQCGTEVYAAVSGTVFYPTTIPGVTDASALHVLELRPDRPYNVYRIYYLHLSTHPTSKPSRICEDREIIPPGMHVEAGKLIGRVGMAGTAGAHLHFEVQLNGVPVDPYGWTGSYRDPYPRGINKRLWQ